MSLVTAVHTKIFSEAAYRQFNSDKFTNRQSTSEYTYDTNYFRGNRLQITRVVNPSTQELNFILQINKLDLAQI